MKLSIEKLTAEAESSGFRPDVLEKVVHLLGLLNTLQSHPFLQRKLALKGGTALNLFIFRVPRLSVDIDLNYTGAQALEDMKAERPKIEQAVLAVFKREGFVVKHVPSGHAGGKWSLRYASAFAQSGTLEVDINFMYRVPLWPVVAMSSHPIGDWQAVQIPLVDVHELAAGKLAALLSRRKARDLFDSYHLLRLGTLAPEKLRIAFVVYGAMNRKDWRTVSTDDVDFDAEELKRQLIPTLRSKERELSEDYGPKLVSACREALSVVLPLNAAEQAFLDLLLEQGEVAPNLLTTDESLQERIRRQPLLKWKALNVRKYKRKNST